MLAGVQTPRRHFVDDGQEHAHLLDGFDEILELTDGLCRGGRTG
jgi:hypothetical protein